MKRRGCSPAKFAFPAKGELDFAHSAALLRSSSAGADCARRLGCERVQAVRFSKKIGVAALMTSVAIAGAASASVIAGPVLDSAGGGFSDTGLGFQALDNSTLTSFTFQNQGQADTIVLTDAAGNILDSVNTPASTPSDTVSVNWSLASGSEYWLLQTTTSNELFAFYNAPLPSEFRHCHLVCRAELSISRLSGRPPIPKDGARTNTGRRSITSPRNLPASFPNRPPGR